MYLNLSRLVLRHFPTGRMNGFTGLLAFGAERNQGAVVNCRFDPTLRNRGVTLRGSSRWVRVYRHEYNAHLLGDSPV